MSMESPIVWFEIPASDFDRAVRFYETVLGVALTPERMGDGPRMANFPYAPGRAGGSVVEAAPGMPPGSAGVTIYLDAAPDLSVALARVEPAGGRVEMAKTLLSPEIGCIAILIDSEGNRIGLHSPN